MDLSAQHIFLATCEQAYAMVTDQNFLAQACSDLGAPDPDITVSADEPKTTRVSGAVDVPPAMAGFLGNTMNVTQEMSWGPRSADGSRSARLQLTVAGLPVSVDANAQLAPTASGCVIDYRGTLTVKIPMIGGMIEKQALPFILDTLAVQQRTGEAWLASHH